MKEAIGEASIIWIFLVAAWLLVLISLSWLADRTAPMVRRLTERWQARRRLRLLRQKGRWW